MSLVAAAMVAAYAVGTLLLVFAAVMTAYQWLTRQLNREQPGRHTTPGAPTPNYRGVHRRATDGRYVAAEETA